MRGQRCKLAKSQYMTKEKKAQQEQYNQLEYYMPKQSYQTLKQRSLQFGKFKIYNPHLSMLVILI
jgi:hypothetical protein